MIVGPGAQVTNTLGEIVPSESFYSHILPNSKKFWTSTQNA